MSVAVTNAPTRFGRVSYRLTSHASSGIIEARLEPPVRSSPKAIVLRLRHPDGKKMSAVNIHGKPHTDFDPQKQIVRVIPKTGAPIAVQAN